MGYRYDFDLPPGLVTMHEASMVIELYRKGGKLVTKAVHKLLRLSYRLLKDQANTSQVTVRPGEKLTVVGDIHGESAPVCCDSARLTARPAPQDNWQTSSTS
jgi:hypothetical protein